ncbi:MAG: endonuclease/exonuclease/phosphatase family protein [Myxococcota bacterium]
MTRSPSAPLQARLLAAVGLLGCQGAPSASDGDTEVAAATTTAASDSGATTTGDPDGTSTGVPWEPPPGFEPFPCAAVAPDVGVRLCTEAADPEAAPDKVFIDCTLEGVCAGTPAPKEALVVMAYNVERGLSIDAQLAAFADGTLPNPDVILLSEADRGCGRTDGRNVAWEMAQALEMHSVFGVEFTELPRPGDSIPEACEHGNAILSRYPIGNAELVRHETNLSWYEDEGEPRLGGRMAIVADIAVGDQLVHVQSLHFESGFNDGPIRAAQAAELAALGLRAPGPVIIGGDTNAGAYVVDLINDTHNEGTTEAFFDAGYVDTHAALPHEGRATRAPGLILDIMFVREATASAAGLCPFAECGELSDHLPVWATITW